MPDVSAIARILISLLWLVLSADAGLPPPVHATVDVQKKEVSEQWFAGSYAEALRTAGASGRLVLIDFSSPT